MIIHVNFPKKYMFLLKNELNNKNQSKVVKYLIVGCLGQIMGEYRQKWSFRNGGSGL